MPTAEMILWAAISGLIIILLAVIGYFLKTGFSGLKSDLARIWEKLEQYHNATEANAREIEKIKARCDERHKIKEAA